MMKSGENAEYLGDYAACEPAVEEAKKRGYKANGCYYCSLGLSSSSPTHVTDANHITRVGDRPTDLDRVHFTIPRISSQIF